MRVFFYARPATPRNAFSLGLAALRRIKARFGDGVEIVCAGEDWSPGQYGVADVLENRGQLEDLDEVAALYRSCDVGIALHAHAPPLLPAARVHGERGGHGVQPQPPHGVAAAPRGERPARRPVPARVAEQVARLVEDPGLRERLAVAGRAEVAGRSWEDELERVWGAMTKSGPRFE